MRSAVAIFLFTIVSSTVALAADSPGISPDLAAGNATGTKRALIVSGLGGDAEHNRLFAETVSKLHQGLTTNLGFEPGNVLVLLGNEAKESDSELIKAARQSTRDELEKAVKQLRESSNADDALWVIVMGHSHFDGRNSWLNLPGPDIHDLDFANLFNGVKAREQVFFITTPTSGIYIKPLSAKGRVIISATEEGWETNETDFPHELARVLASPPATVDFDVDGDQSITVFDLYITLARNIAQSYLDGELLATEHPLLDDNGDRRGTEVQIDFLTVDQGGRPKRSKSAATAPKPNAEGTQAKSIRLPFPQKEAQPPPKTES